MLLGCAPTMAGLLPVGLVILFIAANFPVGLAAMTAALSRRGLAVPVINKVVRVNYVTGLCLFASAFFVWQMFVPALLLVAIAGTTALANRWSGELVRQPVDSGL